MGILEIVFKNSPSPPIQCCEPITQLDARFAHCFSTLSRGEGGGNTKLSKFSHNFCHCLKKSENF